MVRHKDNIYYSKNQSHDKRLLKINTYYSHPYGNQKS